MPYSTCKNRVVIRNFQLRFSTISCIKWTLLHVFSVFLWKSIGFTSLLRLEHVKNCNFDPILQTLLLNITPNFMVTIDIEYQGELRCKAVHQPSGKQLFTDAPLDNKGKGESFSPTDLLATSLGACILTIMGIAARNRNIDITGTIVNVVKGMVNDPVRRVGSLDITIILPKREYSEGDLAAFHHAAKTCPVMQSINPEINVQYSMSISE